MTLGTNTGGLMGLTLPQPPMPAPQPQQAQQPPEQGQPSPEAQPTGKEYNGTIDVQGEKVEVTNGIAMFQGKKYLISHDGTRVIDENRNVVAKIVDGKVEPVTEEDIAEMKQKGVLE